MVKEIRLTQGKAAIVDDEDFERLSEINWHFAGGYARRNKRLENGKRRMEFMHRIIAETPDGMFTDHINGNALDNRKCNLRNVSKAENAKKRSKESKGIIKIQRCRIF